MIDRIISVTSRLLLIASALALAAMMVILCWQVVVRYIFDNSPAWAEQSALLLMIWMTFLGTASGIADGFHIRIAEGVANLSGRWQSVAIQSANLFIIIAGIIIFWFGTILVIETWYNDVPTLPMPKGAVYSVIPVSGILMALFALHHLVRGTEISGSRGSA